MKHLILTGAAFLTLAACDGSEKTGPAELTERTDAARAAAAMSEAPADAPALPANLSYNEQGWAVWADWRYHTSGLVCPPDMEGFTFSKNFGEGETRLAACSYYGPAFQVMRMTAVESGARALSAFEQEQTQTGYRRIDAAQASAAQAGAAQENALAVERLVTGDSTGQRAEMRVSELPGQDGDLVVMMEYAAPEDEALAEQVFEAARKAQNAFTKRDQTQSRT